MLNHADVVRLYGPWRHRTPADATGLLTGYPGRWWVAGGWAVEAFTGVPRPHGDLDIGIPAVEVPLLRDHLAHRMDVWAAFGGSLRPLVDREEEPPEGCGNLWLRVDGAAPWEYDVTVMTTRGPTWVYKRDARIALPLEEVVWERDGVSYLAPEVQLLHKAPGLRDEDQFDFEASVPLLEDAPADWLRWALQTAHPGHPWLERLSRRG